MYIDENEIGNLPSTGKSSLLPYSIAILYGVIPIEMDTVNPIVILTSRDQSLHTHHHLRFILKREVVFCKISQEKFEILSAATWSHEEKHMDTSLSSDKSGYSARVGANTSHNGDVPKLKLEGILDGMNTINQVDQVLSRAIGLGASDIHFEPQENELKIRFRLDGVLQQALTVEKPRQNEMLSRLKILAHMDIAEKRRPQDGRILVEGNGKSIDVRVSSMPTPFGEKLVLRLLDKSKQALDLRALGMEGRNLELFNEAIRKSFGMILVTGPTGSGKTTTLYAALNTIQTSEINISTVEDPIEYQLAGINQTQMNEDINYTFASAVRTFLRQDPDIIMIGEIRDPETAKYAIQAAQTGHLVFSTLHTNDAPGAIVRLLEMGMEPYLVASTVHLIMAQRLVRKICTQCKKTISLTDKDKAFIARYGAAFEQAWHGEGCDACAGTGYKGRLGVFEIMPVSPEIQELVTSKASTQKVKELAVSQGMRDLNQEGLRLVQTGITTLDEIRSVVI